MDTHRVCINGRMVFSGEEDSALDFIEDLALQYYETGNPDPSTITLDILNVEIEVIPEWEEKD